MTHTQIDPELRHRLRVQAETTLRTGTAPKARLAIAGTQALTLLYDLASNPDTAGDALKLLHELQVHQVELELQHEQAELECQRLAEALAQRNLQFTEAPVGYVTLDADGRVHELNRLAADWLGVAADGCAGRRIEDLLDSASAPMLRAALAQLRDGADRWRGVLRAASGGRDLQARLSRADGLLLMAFMASMADD